jgi:hypothetical protein
MSLLASLLRSLRWLLIVLSIVDCYQLLVTVECYGVPFGYCVRCC